MKKVLIILSLLLAVNAYASMEVDHDKPNYVTSGRYIYKIDKDGNLLGYYQKSVGGKIRAYDENGKLRRTYKAGPGGRLRIYDENGNKVN